MSDIAVKRVLMTGDTVGGVWTYTLELTRALRQYGVEVVLATMGGDATPAMWREAASISNLTLFTSDYKLEWMDDPWRDVRDSSVWLLDLEKQFAPDLIHLNSYGHGSLGWHAPVILTTHSCVLSWWAAVKSEPIPPSWNRYRDEVTGSLRSAGLVTAPSRAMLRTLAQNYGTDLPESRVVPNGRSAFLYYVTSKEPFILAAGRLWDEAKNIATLAKVAEKLAWPVYVAGDDRHPNGASSEFAFCRRLGRLSQQDLASWYARAEIYALPARYEPFGLSALEAALSGCALVLGDIESLREMWEDAAVFVPPDDELSLEAALRELIASPRLRKEMARRSTARAGSFTAERMARGYMDAYDCLLRTRMMACAS